VKLALAAGVLAIVLSIAIGPAFISYLRNRAFGQQIREEGPAGHRAKQGTPTMGGVFLLACAMVAFAVVSKRTAPGLTVAAVTLACAGIGFADDYLKLAHRRSLGLSGRWKMVGLGLVTLGLGIAASRQGLSTDVYLPIIDGRVDLGPVYYLLLFLVVAGAANAVNLTDGLDGLAAGTMTIAMLTYTAMMIVASRRKGSSACTRRAMRGRLTWPSWARPWSAAASASSGTTPTRRTSSWATPARSGWAGRWPRWRCCPRPSSC
jgi:phospho-N-acetylmuramoyl-pentapeptide-transferase